MNNCPLLEKIRFTPEKQKADAILSRFGLAPVISHFEQEGASSDAVTASHNQH